MPRALSVSLVVALTATAACSSAVAPDGGEPRVEIASEDVDRPPVDASPDVARDDVVDVAVDAIADVAVDAPTTPYVGFIEALVDYQNDAQADAHFYLPPPSAQCTTSERGPCTVTVCTRPPNEMYHSVTAGIVFGGDEIHPSRPMLQQSTGSYFLTQLTSDYWTGSVHFNGTGGDFPPFDVTLPPIRPTNLIGFMPRFDGRSFIIDRTQSIALQWAPTAGGQLTVRASVGNVDETGSLRCAFEGTAGQGTVPVEAIALLPVTGPDAGSIDIALGNEMDLQIGAATLHARTAYLLFAESAGAQ